MGNLKYPIGVQSFSKLRTSGLAYVDKTRYVQKLVSDEHYVFLNRPRRFGKSLLMSTIEAFFKGERELFNGLAISDFDWDWQPYPVLHIDFTGANYKAEGELEAKFDEILSKMERELGVDWHDKPASVRFGKIIETTSKQSGRRVVILIDEYDKPLLETVGMPEMQEKYRAQLRGLYGNLKNKDSYIQFAMLTGVTKFGKLSIFSDLNNLRDISLSEKYAGICGITSDDLHEYFDEGVREFATKHEISLEAAYEELKKNYDGYHFSPEGSPDVYNPFSLLNALHDKAISDYWFETRTPNYLIELIKANHIQLEELTNTEVDLNDIRSVYFDPKMDFYSVMYKSGCLTIKGFDSFFNSVILGYPNLEVERGLSNLLKSVGR